MKRTAATRTTSAASAKPKRSNAAPTPPVATTAATEPVTTHLALLTLDLNGGDSAAAEAVLTRFAQLTRYTVERAGVEVGDVRFVLIPGLTGEQFFAALASLRGHTT